MIDAEVVRQVRGWILRLLADLPVDGSTGKRVESSSPMLVQLLRRAGFTLLREDVDRQLAYLGERGYVELTRFSGAARRIMREAVGARIVAKGVDVLEGTAVDPGVDVSVVGSEAM